MAAQLPAFAARMSASITAELDREWIEQASHALYLVHCMWTACVLLVCANFERTACAPLSVALHVRHIEQEGQQLTTT